MWRPPPPLPSAAAGCTLPLDARPIKDTPPRPRLDSSASARQRPSATFSPVNPDTVQVRLPFLACLHVSVVFCRQSGSDESCCHPSLPFQLR